MTETGFSGTTSGSHDADDQEEWPDWRISDQTVAQLARYVSPAHVPTWMPTNLLSPLDPWADAQDLSRDQIANLRRARADQLYKSLAARRIPYANEQWNPAAYDPEGNPAAQRIRTPEETAQGPATCLDLALLFAAMAIAADLRPLIAVRHRPSCHALVVLDLSGTAADLAGSQSGDGEPASRRAIPGFEPRLGEPGVWDQVNGKDRMLVRLAQDPELLPVNVVDAARNYGTEFTDASGLNAALTEDSAGSRWVLVDVRWAQVARGEAPYLPPRGRSVPPIHSYLPMMTGFREFNSRSGSSQPPSVPD